MQSNKESNQKLIERFPFLIPRNRWTGKIPEDYDYSYTELDSMPDGWRKAFGEQMCEDIREELVRAEYLDQYRITQIKEKYGTLCWYDFGQEHLEDCRVSDWMICRSFTPRNLNTTILKNRRNSIMDDGKVTITIEVDAELLAQVTEVLKPYGLTPEEAAVQFFEYCADPKTQDHAITLLKRWKEEQEAQERNSTNAK